MISDEDKKLLETFKALNLKPKADTPEDLQKWLSSFGERKEEQQPAKDPPSVNIPLNQQPRISIFYGDVDSVTKGEVNYDQWRFEIHSLLLEKTYRAENILQAIRRSVRGEAGRILMRLGPRISIDDILEKFDSVYGVVESNENLMSKFYSAKQRDDEDITAWSCRLEDILSKVVERGMVAPTDTDNMLCSMLWTGLRRELKDISGYKFDTIKNFDKLRVELRKIELDHLDRTDEKITRGVAKSSRNRTDYDKEEKSEPNSDLRKEMKELRGMMQEMSTTVTAMGNKLDELSQKGTEVAPGRGHRYGRKHRQWNRQSRNRSGYRPPHYSQDNRQQGSQGTFQQNEDKDGDQNPSKPSYKDRGYNEGPQCYRCFGYGHFQWQCSTRLDHSKRLNFEQPALGGKQ